MSKLKAVVTGTINLDISDAAKIDLRAWKYALPNGDEVSSLSYNSEDGTVNLPRNFKKFQRVVKRSSKKEIVYEDKRFTNSLKDKFELHKSFALREEQEEAVNELLKTLSSSKENAAILKAQPGFGKSYILPYIVKEIGQRALILVDRVSLVTQMSNEFNTNVDSGHISVLSSKNKEIGDVNIATFQFLLKNPAIVQELSKEVGLVVVDECHTISIGAFTEIVNNLPAKYRLGLSATPSRSDGLTEALYDVMSRNIVEGNVKNPVKVTYLFIERPTFVPSIFYDKPNIEWGNFYATEVVRDDVVAVASKMVEYDRAVLVYSTYVKAQESYAKKLNELGISAAVVNQHTSKKEKEAILQDFNDGKIKVLVSGVILQKGISIHRLDTVVNAGNLNKENIEQLIGRLRRKHPDKKNPIFIDLIYRGRGFTKGMQRLNFIRKIRETTKEELKYWVVATAEKRINEWKKTYLKD